jgi:hypothetical protein
MHSSTKERFELISDIINILGEKGREVRIDYVSDLLQNKFANKFKNNFDYELYFDSQINILIYKNKFKITYSGAYPFTFRQLIRV